MREHFNIPNCVTVIRIIGAVALCFTVPFSAAFYAVYIICGVTDVLDGFLARTFGWSSDFGAKLDSAADLLFYFVTLVKTMPVLWAVLPRNIWIVFGIVLFLRFIMYMTYAIRDHEFGSQHTYLNKLTGIMVFMIALLIKTSVAVTYCYVSVFVALAAVLYELFLRSKNISGEGKTDK